MKKNILLIALVGMFFAALGLQSCSPDYETNFEVKTLVVPDKSLSPVYFNIDGGESEAKVNTNVPFDMWTASSNADWLMVEKHPEKVVISAGSNNIYTTRTGRVTIEYGHQSYDIVVSQLGKESTILVDGKREGVVKNATSTQEALDVEVLTNLKLDNIIVPDTVSWVSLAPQMKTRAGEGALQTVTFNLEANTDTVVRYCEVILQSSDNYDYITTFLILQDKRGYIVQADDSVKTFNVAATGEVIEIPFNINGPVGNSYTYEVEESAKDWIVQAPATAGLRPAAETFSVLPNIVEEPRVGHITFTSTDESENSSFVVTINQEKFIPVPPENVVNPTTTPGPGSIIVGWDLPENLNYTKLEISYFDQVFKQDVVKTIDNNKLTEFKIENTYKAAGEYTFTIRTYGPTGMETETPVTVSGVSDAMPDYFKVNLTADMLSTNAQEPSEGPIRNLVDGNINTYFHSKWSNPPVGAPHYFEIHLTKPIQEFNYNFVTRHNGDGGGDVKRMKIEVSNDNGSTWKEAAVHSYTMPGSRGQQVNGQPASASNPFSRMRLTPLARRSADPINNSWFNMAEFRLFEKNPYPEIWAESQL